MHLAAAAAALALGFCGAASALTVTQLANAPTAWATATAATPDSLNLPGAWSVAPATRTGSLVNVYRSPFDNQGGVGGDNSSYIGKSYWAVGPGNTPGPAYMTFATAQNSLTFLWGSVDTWNVLEFYLNGVSQGSVVGGSFPTGNPAGRGASYVNVSGVVFDKIKFATSPSQNAFEFSNLSTTAVPIPAAVWLLGSGLLGLVVVGRRRKAGAPAAA